jgi:negative regulator of genetic competence, sporulation and motility
VNGLKIEKMGQETIKVTIANREMRDMSIEPGTLSEDNLNTHMFFVSVFNEIKRKYAVDLRGMHLYLEVFTLREDTTMIYISMVNEPEMYRTAQNDKYVYVYFSDCLEELSAAAKDIIASGGMTDETESRFFISDEGYFLVIKSDSIVLKTTGAVGAGEYCAEYIEEHFDVVEKEQAVEKLAQLMF